MPSLGTPFLEEVGSAPRAPDVCSRVQSPVEAGQPFLPPPYPATLRFLWGSWGGPSKVHNPGILQRKPFPTLAPADKAKAPIPSVPVCSIQVCSPEPSVPSLLTQALAPVAADTGAGRQRRSEVKGALRGYSALWRGSGGASATHCAGPRVAASEPVPPMSWGPLPPAQDQYLQSWSHPRRLAKPMPSI